MLLNDRGTRFADAVLIGSYVAAVVAAISLFVDSFAAIYSI